jgi:hypothetical protein
MGGYYDIWSDHKSAMKMLDIAVSRYVAANLGSRAIDIALCPPHFMLDADTDAVQQLSDFYKDLLHNSPDGGDAMLDAARQLFDIERMSSPPRYFNAAILGTFLLIAAPASLKPHPGEFLRFLRPLLASKVQVERDLYFSALLGVGDASSQFPQPLQNQALSSLFAEWDFLSVGNRKPPASLARLLCNAQPHQWPSYLISACEAKWPSAKQGALEGPNQFARGIQNILSSVEAGALASEFWRLAHFLQANRVRAESIMRAIFRSSDAADRSNAAPFTLIKPNTEQPPRDWTEWRIASAGVTQDGRAFRLERGNLDPRDPEAYATLQLLIVVACQTSLLAMAA